MDKSLTRLWEYQLNCTMRKFCFGRLPVTMKKLSKLYSRRIREGYTII